MEDAAVMFLLEKVAVSMKYYGHLMTGGAEEELQKLKSELQLLKDLLVVVVHEPREGELFKQMNRQMREVVYEVEDALDMCLTQAAAAAAKAEERMFAPARNFDLAKEIKSLRQDMVKPMVRKAMKDFATMQTGDGSGGSNDEGPPAIFERDRGQRIRQEKVVGFAEEVEAMTTYLVEQSNQLDVISIIGMPGLGKTTLAWKIYGDERIQYEFHIRIWVNVSQDFNKMELFLNILKVFTSEDMSGLSEQELEKVVRASLEEEMFLIVFDDVWTVDDWNSIKNVLPMSNGMGKVILTSRNREVGTIASRHIREPFMLRFLTNDESWELLQLEVFGDVGVCPQELEAIGQHIASNCHGVALNIVAIGGILAGQYTKQRSMGMIRKDWVDVSREVTHLLLNERKSADVLAMSYNTLPDELRECFLYMGVFPEDHEIPTWTLTRLWIAEGFIQQKEGQSLEETAEEYLNDIINRNLLMVGRTNPMGESKTCRAHSTIRAFCTSKAAEQNLFQEPKKYNEGFFEQPLQNYHRICFHSDDLSNFLSGKPKGPRVRSFLCFNDESIDLETKYITAIPDAFGLLRVLDSKSIKFDLFPTKLIKLIHLRYVTLRVDDLKILPEPISQLWNLQTLVVETNSRTLAMKANIWKMVWLRHLKTKATTVLDPNWEGEAGENLQTVSRLSPESCTKSVSRRAHNIRELGICGNLATLFDDNKFLQNLRLLEKLKLVNDVYYEMANNKDYKPIIRLPQHYRFPPNLKRLTLTKTSLDWEHMSSTLAKIETLEALKLKDNAFTGMMWTAVGDGFPSLMFLVIEEADMVIWEASADHFPSLMFLSIKNCRKLKTIPHELSKNLQKLDIDFLRRSATDSARYIQELKEKEQRQEQNLRRGDRFQLSVGSGCES